MPPVPPRPAPARPSAADVQRQIVAYLGLPLELRDRLDPRRLVLAELQRAYVGAWQTELAEAA